VTESAARGFCSPTGYYFFRFIASQRAKKKDETKRKKGPNIPRGAVDRFGR